MLYKSLVLLGLLIIVAAQLPASRRATLVFRGEYASDGTLLLQPMISPQLGVYLVAGPPPKKGQVLNCTIGSRKLQLASRVDHATEMLLSCGKTTFAVRGIILN